MESGPTITDGTHCAGYFYWFSNETTDDNLNWNPEEIFLEPSQQMPCHPGRVYRLPARLLKEVCNFIAILLLPFTLRLAIMVVPVVIGCTLSGYEASAQSDPSYTVIGTPLGSFDMINSLDTTPNAKIYNSLTTKVTRDSIIAVRIAEDFTRTIEATAPPKTPYTWNCNQSMLQLYVNSHNIGKDTYYAGYQFYNGYDGNDLELIYQNGGTLKDEGKLGLPAYYLSLYDPVTLKEGHAMNAVLTGDTITKFEDWNLIEPQAGGSKLQPGQGYLPMNCEQVQIYYQYAYEDLNHEKNYGAYLMLEFKLVDGKATLTYNINNDTKPMPWANNTPLNELIRLYTTRDQTINLPKQAKIITPENNSIKLDTKDPWETNVKYEWEKTENATQYELLIAGNNTFVWGRQRYLVQDTDTIIKLDNNTTYYSKIRAINNQGNEGPWSKTTRFKTTTTGINDIIKTDNIKIYPNPARNYISISIPTNKNSRFEIYSVSGKLEKQVQTGEATSRINVESLKAGMYILKVTGNEFISVAKFIKQ